MRYFLIIFFVFNAPVQADIEKTSCCSYFLAGGLSSSAPDNPQDFAEYMSKGMLLEEGQSELFEFYRNNWFKGEAFVNSHSNKSLQDVLEFLKKSPALSERLQIREQIISFQTRSIPRPESLVRFLRSFRISSSGKRNNLLQIEDNLGFWQKMFGFEKLDEKAVLTKTEIKKLKDQYRETFLSYLDTVIDEKMREFIRNPSHNNRNRLLILYKILNRQRKKMLVESKDVKFISQAIVDLAETAGFGNNNYVRLIKSRDLLENVDGLQKILEEKEIISSKFGFKNGFQELRQTLNVKPTEDITHRLRQLKQYIADSDFVVKESKPFRLRALSVQEAPFRSCLGGDCATSVYFYTPLDPNYYIFTLTDDRHKSSGYTTVVLGHALDSQKRKVKTAFVDKVQNVPEEYIISVLEGIRLSLKEHGYTLGVPKRTGGENGLSNDSSTRRYIESKILPYLAQPLNSFEPHKHPYKFESGHSRAEHRMDMLEFEKKMIFELNQAVIAQGEIHSPFYLADNNLDLNTLYKSVLELKDSDRAEDQIKFLNSLIPMMKVKDVLHLPNDFLANHTHSVFEKRWYDFKMRKQALYIFLEGDAYHVKTYRTESPVQSMDYVQRILYKFFTAQERKLIIGEMSNWKDTRRQYKKMFIRRLSSHTFQTKTLDELDFILNSEWGKILDVNTSLYNSHYLETPLMSAISYGDMDRARLFLEHGADVNIQNYRGNTALIWAVLHGSASGVELLLKSGADVSITNNDGESALVLAADEGNLDMVRRLLRYGADDVKVKMFSCKASFLLNTQPPF